MKGLTEHQIQSQYFDWVEIMRQQDWRYELIYAIPNGGKRHISVAKKLKKEGVRAGIWDTSIDFPAHGFHGLKIEFKDAKGKLSKEQKEMGMRYRKAGYLTFLCRSFEFAKEITLKYLDEK